MFFMASRLMRSATILTSSEAGCGTEMAHWSAGLGCPVSGETAIIGTFNSVATAIIAMVDGVVAVPIRRSTFSSSISLRALRVAAEGSEPSSSWISLIFSPLTSLLYSMAAWMPRPYGMPIEEPGPLSEVTNPIVISACAVEAATRLPMRAVKLNILRIAFPLVENSRDLSEMSAWIEVGPARSMPRLSPKPGAGMIPASAWELSDERHQHRFQRRAPFRHDASRPHPRRHGGNRFPRSPVASDAALVGRVPRRAAAARPRFPRDRDGHARLRGFRFPLRRSLDRIVGRGRVRAARCTGRTARRDRRPSYRRGDRRRNGRLGACAGERAGALRLSFRRAGARAKTPRHARHRRCGSTDRRRPSH